MSKYIKEVFNDYKVNSNLLDAEIENIDLFKKTNKLQVKIASSKEITLPEIEEFEDYLVRRFKVNKASLDINYGGLEIKQNIFENWNNIISYISKKEPFSKSILTNSKVELNGKDLKVKLPMKGASFLLAQKFDKGIEHLLGNLYNQNYVVEFVENNSEELNKMLDLKKQEDEKIALEEMRKQAEIDAELEKEKRRVEAEKEKQRKLDEEKAIKEKVKEQSPEFAAKIEAYEILFQ